MLRSSIIAHWDALLDLDAIQSLDTLPIDAFKALDTTRIFVKQLRNATLKNSEAN